jgi:thymidylate synthase
LTYLIAAKTNLIPDELIISFGNVHIYDNHVEAVKEQLSRTPLEWCHVEIDDPSTWELNTIVSEQIHLKNYTSEGIIKAPMAI